MNGIIRFFSSRPTFETKKYKRTGCPLQTIEIIEWMRVCLNVRKKCGFVFWHLWKNVTEKCYLELHQSHASNSHQKSTKQNHLQTMLNRHNSMSSVHQRQPIMPFKWRPFDMYNDVHVHDTHPSQKQQQHDTNVCERPTASNCVQSYQCEFNHLHSHLGLDQHHVIVCDNDVKEYQRQRWHRHRQSSRGSSSGGSSGSCASISTVSRYFVNDIDNSETNVDGPIVVSCGSIDCFCCKLDSQRLSNNDKTGKSTEQQHEQLQQQCHRHTDCSECYNVKCCTPNCRKISSKYTKIMNNSNNNVDQSCKNNSKSIVNRVVVMPFDGIDYTYKCEQSMIGTLNHCESPSMTIKTTPPPTTTNISSTNSNGSNHNDCPTVDQCMKINHCCHAGYFDSNWMIGHRKQRPGADASSKYTFSYDDDLPFRTWTNQNIKMFCAQRQHVEVWKVVGEFPKLWRWTLKLQKRFWLKYEQKQFHRQAAIGISMNVNLLDKFPIEGKKVEIETSFDIIYGLLLYFTWDSRK